MALPMPHPFKHPKTGIFWMRKRVPKDLIQALGRVEVTRSLETRDPTEAKRRLVQALSELEAQWANLRGGSQTLSEREAHGIASEFYERWLLTYRDNPSQQTAWRVDLGDKLWAPSPPPEPGASLRDWILDSGVTDGLKMREMENWCAQGAQEVLAARG